jgi:uncharacterized protein YndB with AHSA1/START domain
MSSTASDRIERQVFIQAPRARVWRALTDSAQFGEWFGIEVDGPFVEGGRVRAVVTHPEYKGLTFEMTIEQMVPEQLFSWRWHPNAIDPTRDYSREPTTLVVFRLHDADGGTLLELVESGFDGVPVERRAEAYRGNEGGWTHQVKAIDAYVTKS